jgi:hypothetical protein
MVRTSSLKQHEERLRGILDSQTCYFGAEFKTLVDLARLAGILLHERAVSDGVT